VAYEKLVVPRFGTKAVLARDDDAIQEESSVIIAGVGQFRSTIGHSAGIAKARVLVIALGDDQKTLALAKVVRERYPRVRILARAVNRPAVFDLLQEGIQDVYREWGTYVNRVRANIRPLEDDLQREFASGATPLRDAAWDNSSLRDEAARRAE